MLTTIENINNKDVIDLSIYEEVNSNIKTINVTEAISEITLTSNNKITNTSIVVKERSSDLLINIVDLNINSGEEIALDLRGGNHKEYKIFLIYSGKNNITSEGNIGICISNNRSVEIIGESNGMLSVNTSNGNTAIGNDYNTCGSGNLIFSGSGYIEILNYNGRPVEYEVNKNLKWNCKVGFYNKEEGLVSFIKILDNVSLKVYGQDGVCSDGEVESSYRVSGGDAINIYGRCVIENNSNGIVELVGGNGGYGIDNNKVIICGNGGSAININDGNLSLIGFTILVGGNSGFNIKSNNLKSIKLGKSGSCINFNEDESRNIKKIRITSCLLAINGINNKDIIDLYGGYFINSNQNLIEITIEELDSMGKGKGLVIDNVNKIADIRELYSRIKISNIYDEFNRFKIERNSEIRNLQVDRNEEGKIPLIKRIRGLFKI